MSNVAAQIRVSGLAKRYGTLEVFRGIDFSVGDREIVAIVGPSGCGKTTLLRCIDGLITADAGEIIVNGDPVTSPISGMAMVFQHFGLFPWKTVYDNVAYGLKIRGLKKDQVQERVAGALEEVGLTHKSAQPAVTLSSGETMRLGLARALAIDPEVLFLDEPTTHIDKANTRLIEDCIRRLKEERALTLIIITHDPAQAGRLGGRQLLLEGGKIKEM